MPPSGAPPPTTLTLLTLPQTAQEALHSRLIATQGRDPEQPPWRSPSRLRSEVFAQGLVVKEKKQGALALAWPTSTLMSHSKSKSS